MNTNMHGDNAVAANAENGSGWGVSRGRVGAWAAVVGLILLVPLVAMQFSEEVNWTMFDFVLMGVLLFGAALTYELVAALVRSVAYRVAVGLAVATSVLLVWINGTVGIIGDGPVNLLYAAVLMVGFVGALIARFQPRGMARALFAMAVTQMAVPVVALVICQAGWAEMLTHPDSPHPSFAPGVAPVFVLNGVFAMLFVGSASLFREAARGKAEQSAA